MPSAADELAQAARHFMVLARAGPAPPDDSLHFNWGLVGPADGETRLSLPDKGSFSIDHVDQRAVLLVVWVFNLTGPRCGGISWGVLSGRRGRMRPAMLAGLSLVWGLGR